jgi:hypothetical protein
MENDMSLIKDWFSKPKTVPLPIYRWEPISVESLPKCSVLTWFGGTKITERFGERLYHFPYHPSPYHTSWYLGDGMVVNVGGKTTIEEIETLLRSTRCAVATIYKFITPEMAERIIKNGILRTASKERLGNKYDWRGFCWPLFGKIPLINKLPWLRPSDSDDFCTDEAVDEIFKESGISITGKDDELSYPWDVITWAEAHPEQVEIRVLWVGPDFEK